MGRGASGDPERGKEPLRCSFCAKSQDEVRKLIAGPKVYICDECIELCVDIITEEWEDEVRRTAGESQADTNTRATGAAVCSLCGGPTSLKLLVEIPERGFLCFVCLEAVRAATESETPNGQ